MVPSIPLLLMSLVVSYTMCIVLVMESRRGGFALGRLNYVCRNGLVKILFFFWHYKIVFGIISIAYLFFNFQLNSY